MSEIWNLSALCRCCHADGAFKSLQAPYVHDGAIEIYAVLLRDTFGLHVNPPLVEASYTICEGCIDQLRLAHRFKKQVLTCERKFEEYCKNEQTNHPSDIVKIEIESDNIDKSPDDDDYDDVDDSDGGHSEIASEFVFGGKSRKSHKQKTNQVLFCEFCNEQFTSKRSKRSHVFERHVADGLTCKICKISFENQEAIDVHFSAHDDLRQCSFCTEVCTSRSMLKEHVYANHIKLTGYVCDYCGQPFKSKSNLVTHINWHIKTGHTGVREFKCETCGRVFNRKANLIVHVRAVHEKLRPFQCCQCGKTYQSNKALVLHNRSHTGERPYKCDVCSKGFKCSTDMKYHRERHNEDLGWNITGDTDDDGADDSDGGYDNNDLDSKSEVEIEDVKHIEVEIKLETETKARDHPRSDNLRTDYITIKECMDLDDDYTHDYLDNEIEVVIEELKDDKKVVVEKNADTKRNAKRNSNVTKQRVKKTTQVIIPRYSCDFCKELFTSKEIMRAHILDKHIADDFTCTMCNLTFKGRKSLISHLTLKHENHRYHCRFCIETFNSLSSFKDHEYAHTKQTGYVCDYCEKRFKLKETLARHVKWHNGIFKEYQCETCGHKFRNRTNLNTHVRSVHDKLRPFKCDLCEKTYTLKKHLINHRRLHTGERPYKCEVCSKCFLTNEHMKVHRQRHLYDATTKIDGHTHQCHVCGKKLASATYLKTHMDSHSKPFRCELCGEGFGQKAGLIRHNKSKHDPRKTSSKNTCSICKKTYANWEIHKRIHDRKPFNCHLCTKFYPNKKTLDRHLNMKHYKERKFPCDICGTMFTRPECVRAHVERRHNSDGHKEKKVRTNKSKEPKQHRTVKVEVLEDNFDSVLPAYAIPKLGSTDENNTAAVAQDAVLGV